MGLGAVIVVAAGVVGWMWAPFGRPDAPSTLVQVTAGPTASPLTSLAAGDCFAELDSPWASDFEPVSCAEPHTAQLTAVIPVDTVITLAAAAAWPGEDALRERAMLACQSPEALDLEAAASIPDLEVQARWPADETEWADGIRSYYCFATWPDAASTGGSSAEQFGSLQP